jgi:hypothetical protein
VQTFVTEERSLHGAAASCTTAESPPPGDCSGIKLSSGGRATVDRPSSESVTCCNAASSIRCRGNCGANRKERDDEHSAAKPRARKPSRHFYAQCASIRGRNVKRGARARRFD